MITIFEKYNTPDLRRVDDILMCIKNYKGKVINFEKDKSYKVCGFYGSPQDAIEKYNILDYLPIEYIDKVIMFDDKKNKIEFKVNNYYNHLPYFLDYFYVPDFTNDTHKYNI